MMTVYNSGQQKEGERFPGLLKTFRGAMEPKSGAVQLKERTQQSVWKRQELSVVHVTHITSTLLQYTNTNTTSVRKKPLVI